MFFTGNNTLRFSAININLIYLPYKRVKSKYRVRGDNAHNTGRRAQIRTQPQSTLSRAELNWSWTTRTELNWELTSPLHLQSQGHTARAAAASSTTGQTTINRPPQQSAIRRLEELGYLRKLIPNPYVASPRIELTVRPSIVAASPFTQQCIRTAVQ